MSCGKLETLSIDKSKLGSGFDTAFDPYPKSKIDAQLMYCKLKCPKDGFVKFQNSLGDYEFVSILDNIKLDENAFRYRCDGMIEGMYTADKCRISDIEFDQFMCS